MVQYHNIVVVGQVGVYVCKPESAWCILTAVHGKERESKTRSGCIKGAELQRKLPLHSLSAHAVRSLAGIQSSAFKDQLWLLEMPHSLFVPSLWRSCWFFHSSCFWTLPWSNFDGVVFSFSEQACNCNQVGRCIPYMCLPLPAYYFPSGSSRFSSFCLINPNFKWPNLQLLVYSVIRIVEESNEFGSLFYGSVLSNGALQALDDFTYVYYLGLSRSGLN